MERLRDPCREGTNSDRSLTDENETHMSEKFPMTPSGFATMKAHLKRLKDVDRPANSRAIEIARGHGDLSENADYSAAKEEQGLIEAKIRELEAKLAMAEVIDPTKLSGPRVKFGATVTIEDTDSGDEHTYTIVGEHEADIKKGRISIGAPVARAMIGKEIGDTITLPSSKGKREVEVTKVEWNEVPPLEQETSREA
jgi:transcription elongation factor GreA